LGRYLRQLREEARITVKVAAEELEWSAPKIWRIESGATSLRSLDVEAMCRVYGASAEATEALKGLARETKARGWWHTYSDAIPPQFVLFIGLESAAARLRHYESELIPGLLQTEAYATEVHRIYDPSRTDEGIGRWVGVRLGRQALLTRTRPAPPTFDVLINEAALRRPMVNRAAMADQLRHITEVARLPNVTIRVLPFQAGTQLVTMTPAFAIMEFAGEVGALREPEPPIVSFDTLTGTMFLDKPDDVAAYDRAWAKLDTACLKETGSLELISSIATEYSS
jgi:transcriptional regulator with XRE-family HTH domain